MPLILVLMILISVDGAPAETLDATRPTLKRTPAKPAPKNFTSRPGSAVASGAEAQELIRATHALMDQSYLCEGASQRCLGSKETGTLPSGARQIYWPDPPPTVVCPMNSKKARVGPPSYKMVEPRFENGSINPFRMNGGVYQSRMDCVAFLSSGMALAGLRVRPNLDTPESYHNLWTRDILSFAKGGNGVCSSPAPKRENCFFEPSDTEGLRVGDLFAWDRGGNRKHTVLFDSVGADPFGIQRHDEKGRPVFQTAKDCLNREKFDPEHMDFVVIQMETNFHLNRKHARFLMARQDTTAREILRLAQRICWAQLSKGQPLSASARGSLCQGLVVSRRLRHAALDGGAPECRSPERYRLSAPQCIRTFDECYGKGAPSCS